MCFRYVGLSVMGLEFLAIDLPSIELLNSWGTSLLEKSVGLTLPCSLELGPLRLVLNMISWSLHGHLFSNSCPVGIYSS